MRLCEVAELTQAEVLTGKELLDRESDFLSRAMAWITYQRHLNVVAVAKLKELSVPDGLFDIQPVRCLGACGLAPVIMIDGEVHGKLDPNRVRRLIARYREGA